MHAGCKVNLGLKISGRCEDGYHHLESVFFPLMWPRDAISLKPLPGSAPKIRVKCSTIPENENILTKAYWKFVDINKTAPPISIELIKRVPIGAGLGGGSANAAWLLKKLYEICPEANDKIPISDLAESIGCDVPFFLQSQPCMLSGKGKELTPVAIHAENSWLVLVFPEISVLTKSIFQDWDREHKNFLTNSPSTSTKSLPEQLQITDIDTTNQLEQYVIRRNPELFALKTALLETGAFNAAMSGSGSTFYGIYSTSALARIAAHALRKRWPRTYMVPMRNLGV